MGEVTAELKYSTDGKETTNSIRGNEIKSTAKWEGDDLAVAGKGSFQGADITLNDRWSLSADGKTLTIHAACKQPHGRDRSEDRVGEAIGAMLRRYLAQTYRISSYMACGSIEWPDQTEP